jgi:hypothetical protein
MLSKNTNRKCFDLQLIMDINQKWFIHDIYPSSAKPFIIFNWVN